MEVGKKRQLSAISYQLSAVSKKAVSYELSAKPV
jgi:hypothetical protein